MALQRIGVFHGMGTLGTWLLGVVVLGGLAGAALSQAEADPLVVTINGTEVHQSEVMRRASLLQGQGRTIEPGELIQQLIGEILMAQEAKKENQGASDTEFDEVFQQLLTQMGGEEALKERLTQVGWNIEDFKAGQRRQMDVQKVIEWKTAGKVDVSEASIEAFYRENPEVFTSVKARHILIRSDEGDPEEKKTEAKTKIDVIAQRVAGGEDFSEIAKAESEDPGSGAQGGSLGEFGAGQMVPPFEEAAFALKEGEVSGVVTTQFGYHLIKLDEKKQATYEEVHDSLKSGLEMREREGILQAWIAELSSQANITFAQGEAPAAGDQ